LVTDTPAYSSELPPYSLGVFYGLGPNALACPDKRYEADKMVQGGLGVGLTEPVYITDDKSRVALIMGSEVFNATEVAGATQCDLARGNDENGLNTANNIAFMKRSSGSRVYVVSEQNTVAILDPVTLQLKTTITVPNAVHLDAIGVDSSANLVWITDEQLMQVFVLRGAGASGTGACVTY
jgi:outer membrane protein assembly factor BamB